MERGRVAAAAAVDDMASDVIADDMPLQESKLLLNIPQNPHYRPLQGSPRSLRRHLISGYDKSFVDVGTKMRKLSAKEFERSKDDLRETLKELVRMGYNVGPLSQRLDALDEALGGATEESDATRAKIKEARRKAEEKKVELTELRQEIKRLQIKEEEKLEGIAELEKWARELEEGLPDVDGIVAKMTASPLL